MKIISVFIMLCSLLLTFVSALCSALTTGGLYASIAFALCGIVSGITCTLSMIMYARVK